MVVTSNMHREKEVPKTLVAVNRPCQNTESLPR